MMIEIMLLLIIALVCDAQGPCSEGSTPRRPLADGTGFEFDSLVNPDITSIGKPTQPFAFQCMPCISKGLYCPGTDEFEVPSSQSIVCPAGAFCPNSTLVFACPPGYFCPLGSSKPLLCEPYAYCPRAGTVPQTQRMSLSAIAFLGVLLALIAGFAGCRDAKQLRVSKAVATVVHRLQPFYLPRIASIRLRDQQHSPTQATQSKAHVSDTAARPAAAIQRDARSTPQMQHIPVDTMHNPLYGARQQTGTSTGSSSNPSPMGSTSAARQDTRNTASIKTDPAPDGIGFVLRDVTVSAKGSTGVPILSHVSCSVPAGKVSLIIGESGAGKTTLLNAMAGKAAAYATIQGTVGVHGRWLDAAEVLGGAGSRHADLAAMRDQAAFIPQGDVILADVTPAEALATSGVLRVSTVNDTHLTNTKRSDAAQESGGSVAGMDEHRTVGAIASGGNKPWQPVEVASSSPEYTQRTDNGPAGAPTPSSIALGPAVFGKQAVPDASAWEACLGCCCSCWPSLRLAASAEETRIRKVLKEVYLTLLRLHVLHRSESLVGADDSGGQRLSGGERKRVSIGMELMVKPRVLFCDEITSGLDASTSLQVMRYLARLAKKQRVTVCAVLHQPRVEIAEVCDHLVLLVRGGRVVYDGPFKDAMQLFRNFGFTFPDGTSRIDVFLDISTGTVTSRLFPHSTALDWAVTWQRITVQAEVIARDLERDDSIGSIRAKMDVEVASLADGFRDLQLQLASRTLAILGPARSKALAYILVLTSRCSSLQEHLGLGHLENSLALAAQASPSATLDVLLSPMPGRGGLNVPTSPVAGMKRNQRDASVGSLIMDWAMPDLKESVQDSIQDHRPDQSNESHRQQSSDSTYRKLHEGLEMFARSTNGTLASAQSHCKGPYDLLAAISAIESAYNFHGGSKSTNAPPGVNEQDGEVSFCQQRVVSADNTSKRGASSMIQRSRHSKTRSSRQIIQHHLASIGSALHIQVPIDDGKAGAIRNRRNGVGGTQYEDEQAGIVRPQLQASNVVYQASSTSLSKSTDTANAQVPRQRRQSPSQSTTGDSIALPDELDAAIVAVRQSAIMGLVMRLLSDQWTRFRLDVLQAGVCASIVLLSIISLVSNNGVAGSPFWSGDDEAQLTKQYPSIRGPTAPWEPDVVAPGSCCAGQIGITFQASLSMLLFLVICVLDIARVSMLQMSLCGWDTALAALQLLGTVIVVAMSVIGGADASSGFTFLSEDMRRLLPIMMLPLSLLVGKSLRPVIVMLMPYSPLELSNPCGCCRTLMVCAGLGDASADCISTNTAAGRDAIALIGYSGSFPHNIYSQRTSISLAAATAAFGSARGIVAVSPPSKTNSKGGRMSAQHAASERIVPVRTYPGSCVICQAMFSRAVMQQSRDIQGGVMLPAAVNFVSVFILTSLFVAAGADDFLAESRTFLILLAFVVVQFQGLGSGLSVFEGERSFFLREMRSMGSARYVGAAAYYCSKSAVALIRVVFLAVATTIPFVVLQERQLNGYQETYQVWLLLLLHMDGLGQALWWAFRPSSAAKTASTAFMVLTLAFAGFFPTLAGQRDLFGSIADPFVGTISASRWANELLQLHHFSKLHSTAMDFQATRMEASIGITPGREWFAIAMLFVHIVAVRTIALLLAVRTAGRA